MPVRKPCPCVCVCVCVCVIPFIGHFPTHKLSLTHALFMTPNRLLFYHSWPSLSLSLCVQSHQMWTSVRTTTVDASKCVSTPWGATSVSAHMASSSATTSIPASTALMVRLKHSHCSVRAVLLHSQETWENMWSFISGLCKATWCSMLTLLLSKGFKVSKMFCGNWTWVTLSLSNVMLSHWKDINRWML